MSKWSEILLSPEKKAIFDAGRAYERAKVLEILDRYINRVASEQESISKTARLSAVRYLSERVKDLATMQFKEEEDEE